MCFIQYQTKIVGLFAVLFACLPLPIFGQRSDKNHIEMFLYDVINTNLYIKSKESSSRAAHHATKNSSRTYPDPEIMITKSSGSKDDAAYFPNQNYQHARKEAMEYRVLQPIPFPGKLTTEASVKRSEAKISEIELAIEKNKMAVDVLNLLVEIKRMEDQLVITEGFYKKMLVLSKVVSSRYSTGSGNLSDVTKVKLKANEYADRVILLKGEYEAAVTNLDYFKNGKNYKFTDNDFELFFKVLHDGIPSDDALEKNSLELALLKEMQERGNHEKNRSRLAFAPDMGVFAGYRKENMKNEYLMYGDSKEGMYSVGITVKVPLWSAFADVSDFKEKKEKKLSSDFASEDYVRKLKFQYSSSEKLHSVYMRRLILLNRELIPQAGLTLDSIRLSWETKKVDFSTLLEAYDSLYIKNMMRYELESQMRQRILILSGIQNSILKNE